MHTEIPFHNIDPSFNIGPLEIHWYGVMYLFGFLAAWLLGRQRARRGTWGWTTDDVTDLILYAAIGVIAGGRLGYVLFYALGDFLADPLSLFRLSGGGITGMSFHGGLIGVLLALWLFARRQKRPFWAVMDFIAPLVPLGLGFGRIGNFINGELWGAPTDLPWGIRFPSGGDIPRHPTMLYEAFLEGLVLFLILWWISSRRPPMGVVSGWFLIGYGVFRTGIEFVREPDAHIGYLFGGWLTMGMVLSIPMILLGILLLAWAKRKDEYPPERPVETEDSETAGITDGESAD
nr:prolipoprotein diacylglyceryl transferase [Actinomycetales bacterium]